jgi:tetratricopeptide (TPR) repeat protein
VSDDRVSDGERNEPAATPWVMLGLVGLVALVHGRSVGFGFVYDDRWTILDNPVVTAPGGLARLLGASLGRANVPDAGRPLMLASVTLDWTVVGPRPWLFHLHNLVLHAAVACLGFLTLQRYGVARIMAALAAAIFAVHPLLVEPVAVINYREDLLAALFGLLALRLAVTTRPFGWLAAALAALAAVAAKENAMLLPLLFVGLAAAGATAQAAVPRGRALLRPAVALAIPAGLAFAWRWWVFGAPGVVSLTAEIPAAHHARAFTLPRGALTFVEGLGQFLLPRGLAPEYPDLPDGALTAGLGWAALAALLAVTALALVRLARSPASPSPWTWVALGWLWAVIAYLPHVGLVPLTNLRADRYFYLPALGIALASATALVAAVARLRPARSPMVTAAVALALLAALGTRSLRHARTFRDDLSLFTAAAAADPDSQRALVGLAAARLRAGQSLAALAAADAALALGEAPRPREMRGIVLMTQGDAPGAVRDLEAALAQAAPAHRPQVLFNLGLARERAGDRAGAARALRESAHLAPLWPLPARALERLSSK